jgi:PGF-pre-PGF domain-containing protein
MALLVIVLLTSGLAPLVHAQFRKATQLTLSPETFTIAPGQSITITAKLTSDGQPLSGKQVAFVATLGSVNPNVATTNENGIASVVYTAPVVSVRTSVTITASFLGDLMYEGSTATCQGVVEVGVGLPTVSISGASFAVPETLKDEVSSYRRSIPEDVLKLLPKLLPIGVPTESFILATPEDLYLVFADRSDSGLAHVEGWKLPRSISLKGVNVTVVVAKSVTFEKEGVPATVSEILANPDGYKFKLVKVSANRKQVSVLYDPDEQPHVEFPITIGYLVEKAAKPLDVVKAILERTKDYALKLDEQFVKSLLQAEEKERLWLFNFNYEYWYDAPAVTNGIVIPTDHPIFELIEKSMPVVGRFARLEGRVVLYDVKTDIPYEAVSSVRELKTSYDKYAGRVVKLVANCYGGYISVQEVIEENTPCGPDRVYVQDIGCVNIVVDARLEGLIAWNEVSVPPKREELLLVSGVSSYHQDEQFTSVDGVFELVGKLVSTKQISNSLPEGVALVLCQAKKIGEIDFEKLAQQVRSEVKDRAGQLYWVLQNIYPYAKQPDIPCVAPRKVFNPVAPIFVSEPREIPEIHVEKNFTINIAVATPEAPIRLNITNSHVTNISIALKEVVKNVTIYFEKLPDRPPNVPKPPGLVYAYHEISVSVSKEALKGADITFWVLKEWLATNNVTAKDVIMLRYYAGKWEELPTKPVGENATHFKFVAETPGFSTFAIAVRVAPTKTATAISIYSVEPARVSVGESVTVKGGIEPAIRALITLRVKEPDGQVKVLNTTSSSDGTFSFTVKLEKEGEYSFVASFPGDDRYEASTSGEVHAVAEAPAPPAPQLALPWLYVVITIIVVIAAIAFAFIRRG